MKGVSNMHKLMFLLLTVAASLPALGQANGTITSAQSVCIGVSAEHSTVGIQVAGTWTGTLQPQVAIQGQPLSNSQVVPSTSTTPQATITGNGVFYANVGAASQFCIVGNTVSSGTASVFLNASKGVNASTLGISGAIGGTVANVGSPSTAIFTTQLNTNGFTYLVGTADPGTCAGTFPATNGSYLYRTDLNRWKFCHGANAWEFVTLANPEYVGLGEGGYSFMGPTAIGNEALVGGTDVLDTLTLKQTDVTDAGNAVGISNTKVWAPPNNAGGFSAIQVDNLSFIVGTASPMTIPFNTGLATDLEYLGSNITTTLLTGHSIKAPTLGTNTATSAIGLLIGNWGSGAGGITSGKAINTGTGLVNFGGLERDAGACGLASDVSLTVNTPNSFCSWTIGAAEANQTWRFACDIIWAYTAATGTPTLAVGVNASQSPTATTNIMGRIGTAASTFTEGPAVALSASGNVNALTSPTLTPGASAWPARISGTVAYSATAGTFAITATANGTTATAAIKAGTTCRLY